MLQITCQLRTSNVAYTKQTPNPIQTRLRSKCEPSYCFISDTIPPNTSGKCSDGKERPLKSFERENFRIRKAHMGIRQAHTEAFGSRRAQRKI